MQVGVLLAQIGEFAFVLLSRASNLHLIEVNSLSLSLSLSVRAHACVEVRMPLKMQMHIFFIIRKSHVCLGLGFSSS
jgi:Kef-type K+ transport system membrane component KefB